MSQPTDEEIAALAGTTLRVRDLLARWGFRTRNHESVPRIELDLARAGLTTDPPFARRPLDEQIRVIPVGGLGPAADPAAPEPAAEDDASEDEDDEVAPGLLPQVAMLIGHLPCARDGVLAVGPDSTLSHAMALMTEHGYSQLPVLDGAHTVCGVITWASIAHMHAVGKAASLANATTGEYQSTDTAKRLLPALPLIREHEFALVRRPDGAVSGIVTAADLADQFAAVAGPFFTLGEIERRLRRCLRVYDENDVKLATNSKKAVDQMMFGGYVKLLAHDALWPKLGWPGVDRDHFVGLLDKVRIVRNAVMHFDAKPLQKPDIDILNKFAGMLRYYDPDHQLPAET